MKNKITENNNFILIIIFLSGLFLQIMALIFLVQYYHWNWLILFSIGVSSYPASYYICQFLTGLLIIPVAIIIFQKIYYKKR